MIYYEYSEEIVRAGLAPAILCCTHSYPTDNLRQMAMAERAFYIEDGFSHDVKNRYGGNTVRRIFSEDELVLKLRAVLI